MSLSVCMIVKNEEDNLKRCLDSVKDIADEIVIVDTGSSDGTIEIAKKYNSNIFNFNWNGSFSDARNFSLEKAKCDWILIMDADDELEKEDKQKLLELTKSDDVSAYFLETLSYVGERPGSDIIMNLNIRLIRNGRGYRFEGAIHEQIIPGDVDRNRPNAVRVEKVRFYHYGYINKTIHDKDKRRRNMEIIQKQLENNPGDSFMLFNMGCEYYALGDFKEALKYYETCYKDFNPNLGYSPKLIMRMATCYEQLGRYNDELKMIEDGLKIYPDFTDLEFLRGNLYYIQQRITLAIKSLKKCIEMGEPPSYLNCLVGVGTFRPYYLLSGIYYSCGDFDEAYKCCIETLKAKSNYIDAFYRIADILFSQNRDTQEIKSCLESFFGGKLNDISCIAICDIFFSKKNYDIALEYTARAEEFADKVENVMYYKGMCLFYLKKFHEAKKCFKSIKAGTFYSQSMYYILLCDMLTGNLQGATRMLKKAEEFDDRDKQIVYKAFKDLLMNKNCSPICIDREESKKYLKPIYELLLIILKLQRFEEFEKGLGLLNLIENDEVLLYLGKLYYNAGFYKQSYKELIRSIKLFDKIDAEGLDMMKKALIFIENNTQN